MPNTLRLFTFFCVLFLTGFHGCLNEKTHKQTHASTAGKLIANVDTRVGTSGPPWLSGNNSPAVQMPWGQVKLGPDTYSLGRMWATGGYHANDTHTKGFSHTRLVGTGIYEGGILRTLPANQPVDFGALRKLSPSFSHRNETAIPGYYALKFDEGGIQAELTATHRVGLHRYTFNESNDPVIYIDLTSALGKGGRVEGLVTTVAGSFDQITGQMKLVDGFSNRYGGLVTYFDIRFPVPFSSYRFLTPQGESATVPAGDVMPIYLELRFNSLSSIEMRAALSYVSIAGASANLAAEAPIATKSFDDVQTENQNTWEALLSRVAIVGSKESDLRKFYSAFYNSCRMPTLFGDYNAANNENYMGFDKQVHTTTGFSYYSDFSLWDTFRTVHPLYMLIARTEHEAMLRSMVEMGQQSGRLPRWAAGNGHVDSMMGFPAAITMTESHLKGITTFGSATAYALQKQQATQGSALGGRTCFDSYDSKGYCATDVSSGSVTYTLEYAYADAALALWADALGNTADATAFRQRSLNYKNLWSDSLQAFVPKNSAGQFLTDCRLDQLSYVATTDCAHHYTEGSGLQYRWYLPFSPTALLDLYTPGTQVAGLESFFQNAPQVIATAVPNGNYWHGNEPSIFASLLFNYLDRPDRTQYWVDWIRRTKYDTTSIGVDGNDDGGTLSAWYVLSGFGFLPIAGTKIYEIVSPLFDKVTLDMGGGNSLEITSPGAIDGKIYVSGAILNGTRLPEPRFSHDDIATGGTLVLETQSTPSQWQP